MAGGIRIEGKVTGFTGNAVIITGSNGTRYFGPMGNFASRPGRGKREDVIDRRISFRIEPKEKVAEGKDPKAYDIKLI